MTTITFFYVWIFHTIQEIYMIYAQVLSQKQAALPVLSAVELCVLRTLLYLDFL